MIVCIVVFLFVVFAVDVYVFVSVIADTVKDVVDAFEEDKEDV